MLIIVTTNVGCLQRLLTKGRDCCEAWFPGLTALAYQPSFCSMGCWSLGGGFVFSGYPPSFVPTFTAVNSGHLALILTLDHQPLKTGCKNPEQ